MTQEREVLTPDGKPQSLLALLDTLPEDQFVDELARVLDRGHTNLRLIVPLPSDVHGEWVPNDPQEIFRKQTLGFEIDTKYAVSNALHSDGTGKPIVGDVIYMTCPKRLKDAFDKLAAKRYEENHGGTKREKNQKEEKDFKSRSNQPGFVDPNVTKVDQSSAEGIDQSVISAAKAANENERKAKEQLAVNTTSGAS